RYEKRLKDTAKLENLKSVLLNWDSKAERGLLCASGVGKRDEVIAEIHQLEQEQRKMKSKLKLLLFKFNFEKAFDSVSWDFLIDVMKQMGFGHRWCKWIKGCLQFATISVLVNGSPTKEFRMERGLHQGDPLSPFLFIIVAEALQSAKNAKNLVRILSWFQDASGLKVNLSKSRLYGIGVDINEVINVANSINCQHDSIPFCYLGLPVGKNIRNKESWLGVVDRINSRLSSWKSRLPLIGGRLTLSKAVLGSLPLYYLSIFKDPTTILKQLKSIKRRFFGALKMRQMEFHGETLSSYFSRLYALESNKHCRVNERWTVLNGVWGGNWEWCSSPRGRTLDKVSELSRLIGNLVLSSEQQDGRLEPACPKKVNICIWRAVNDMLPTRANLLLQGLTIPSSLCHLCGLEEESMHHIILSCLVVSQLWSKFWKWWRINQPPNMSSISDVLDFSPPISKDHCKKSTKLHYKSLLGRFGHG
ncbi:RNA-directed DNA polymerase, eukaryota, partial [Tanacetum coccineum]